MSITRSLKSISQANAKELAIELRAKFIGRKTAYSSPMIVTALRQFRSEQITHNKLTEQHDEFIVVNRSGNKRLEINVLHNGLEVASLFVNIKESF